MTILQNKQHAAERALLNQRLNRPEAKGFRTALTRELALLDQLVAAEQDNQPISLSDWDRATELQRQRFAETEKFLRL